MFYRLDERNEPQPCSSVEYHRWESANPLCRRVAETRGVDSDGQPIRISTVFLGLEHGEEHGRPVLFETMIFGGEQDQWFERYTSWADALEGHNTLATALGLCSTASDGEPSQNKPREEQSVSTARRLRLSRR